MWSLGGEKEKQDGLGGEHVPVTALPSTVDTTVVPMAPIARIPILT